ncbi:hypothetical protein CLOP_g10008, partial [Closterium sp. NIES-67]
MSFFSRLIKGSRVSEDLDQEYPVRKDVDVSQVSKFRPRVKKRLSKERWEACLDEFGRVWAIDAALKHIQRGGIEPSIRSEVWPFLLGLFSPNSTYDERDAMREARRVGEERIRKWRLGLHQIGVDVQRADRTLVFYEEEGNRSRLMEVLAVYSWFDPEVGYCQGMSDLMSPFIVTFPNNADAFWCFERLMRPIRSDFMGTSASIGVQKEIDNLKNITRVLDPELYAHLDEIGAGSMFFTVRPIMAMFRRELSFADSIYFWEMMWSWDYDARDADLLAMADQSVLHHTMHLSHSVLSPHALDQASFAAATTAAAEAAAAVTSSEGSGVVGMPSDAAKAAASAAAAAVVTRAGGGGGGAGWGEREGRRRRKEWGRRGSGGRQAAHLSNREWEKVSQGEGRRGWYRYAYGGCSYGGCGGEESFET